MYANLLGKRMEVNSRGEMTTFTRNSFELARYQFANATVAVQCECLWDRRDKPEGANCGVGGGAIVIGPYIRDCPGSHQTREGEGKGKGKGGQGDAQIRWEWEGGRE